MGRDALSQCFALSPTCDTFHCSYMANSLSLGFFLVFVDNQYKYTSQYSYMYSQLTRIRFRMF